MAYQQPQWEDDFSRPVFNPYSPLGAQQQPAPAPASSFPAASASASPASPPSSALPEVYYPDRASARAPEVAYCHDAPVVHEQASYPEYAPGPAVQPSGPYYVGPGDLMVPMREGERWDPRMVAGLEKPAVPGEEGKKKREDGWWWKCCGRVPAKWRWVILAVVVLAIAGIAAGVVISNVKNSNNNNENTANEKDSTNSPESTSPTTNSPTPTTSSPPVSATSFLASPSTTPGPGSVAVECPGANNTAWWVSTTGPLSSGEMVTTNATFVRLCSRAFAVADAAAVVNNRTVEDFGECMSECALWNTAWPATGWRSGEDQRECVGVSWGYADRQGTADNYCWLIKKANGTGTEREDWESALLVDVKVVDGGD